MSVLRNGESCFGSGPNASHINLYLGPKDGPVGAALVTGASTPGPGHIPFQCTLRPNLPVKPTTLFIAKAVLRDANHENMTWGPAQAGVAVGVTKALLDGVLPPEAEDGWVVMAAVWVHWLANDADAVFTNNRDAAYQAAERAMAQGWPGRADLADGVNNAWNAYYKPNRG